MNGIMSQSGSALLRERVDRNRSGQPVGVYAVCSAHPTVLRAAMRQALDDNSMVLVESTSNQVNQFGGYTGMTPEKFVSFLRSIAQEAGLAPERLVIGSDHLGPYPWRAEASKIALEKACALARACVLAGYLKIHLDASMSCGGDRPALDEEAVAQRAAQMCAVAERARAERGEESPAPLYVIGTEVPVPGGEQSGAGVPQPTTVEHVRGTLESFQSAFFAHGLQDAWKRVMGLVVQSGAEFSDTTIFDYDPQKTNLLRRCLPESPPLIYEAHSTDYQTPNALKQMVQDHFAILKVGPWLTFAYREAIFALAAVERDWLGNNKKIQLSAVVATLEAAMLGNPAHWKGYFGDQDEAMQSVSRKFGYSDRCRYYWPDPAVQKEVDLLLRNLSSDEIPLTLISQHFPEQYGRIRAGELPGMPGSLIEQHIRKVLTIYSRSCLMRQKGDGDQPDRNPIER
jgi:D-tagatose-1,6-bisphosphate aldolase subunit GatZ/KbaZ